MKTKFLILALIAGLLSACGSRSTTEAPASPPTEELVSPTQAPASTDTAIPPTQAPAVQPTAEPAASAGISFANDVLPILQSRCLNCHGGDRVEEGLVVKTYEDLMAGSDNGPVILPGNADGSLFIELVVSQKMPKRGPKLTPPQTQLLIDWINQGALNN
jgi:hypothetical protein